MFSSVIYKKREPFFIRIRALFFSITLLNPVNPFGKSISFKEYLNPLKDNPRTGKKLNKETTWPTGLLSLYFPEIIERQPCWSWNSRGNSSNFVWSSSKLAREWSNRFPKAAITRTIAGLSVRANSIALSRSWVFWSEILIISQSLKCMRACFSIESRSPIIKSG